MMMIDIHTRLGCPRRTEAVDRAVLATMRPAGLARTELPGFSRHPEIAAAVTDRGLTRKETEKVCSGNWLRILRAVRS